MIPPPPWDDIFGGTTVSPISEVFTAAITNAIKLVQKLLEKTETWTKECKPVPPYKVREVPNTLQVITFIVRYCPVSETHAVCNTAQKIYFCTASDLEACS